ncbi:hypothetical protein CVV38_00465 [Candidatus Peregrinibacteria bacterium HGW-Peregrinibacteria-1]|jgi:hypothetical protein|nr:MAG: hypothetical protein CVV38_00465 [Candidatus Peregrinibacteria bacterium HGW-Peregrinibacteria-1]
MPKTSTPTISSAVQDLPPEVREKIATQLLTGQGTISEIISELALQIGQQVTFTKTITLEKVGDAEKACLEAMKEDFDRGIVRIKKNARKDLYQTALKEDPTAGQSWETIQKRLLANEETLLKKAVELSKLTGDPTGKGTLLIGIHKNGELAIRQRSPEIVNAKWTKFFTGFPEDQSDKGELQLLFHPEAIAQKEGQWAKPLEIFQAVEAAGYHLPADTIHNKGLVAASEAVTNSPYVMSPDGKEWREAQLRCPKDTNDHTYLRVVRFYPDNQTAYHVSILASTRVNYRGAILWLRG